MLVLLYSLIPVVASTLGGIVAALWPPNQQIRSVVQHFTAGVVFAAAAIELLPLVEQQSPLVAIIGFAIGIVVMLALRKISAHYEDSQAQNAAPVGMAAAIGLDIFIDGLVTGAGFAVSSQTGILLTIALALEFLFLGLSIASSFGQHSSRGAVVGTALGLSLLAPLGAAIGILLLGQASATILATVLAFGAVALMYLVTEELLVEAHEVAETSWSVAMFFVGFLLYLVIKQLV